MASKKKTPPVEDLDLDEDELEDLDEIEDEVEEEDTEDEDVDEEDVPATKRKKKLPTNPKSKKTRKTTGGIGTADLADALETDGRSLRIMLRSLGVAKNPENNRYEWDSVDAAVEALGFDSIADVQEALEESKKERITELKKRVEKKRTKGKKRRVKEPEPENDEDDEIDLDDEEEEPAPKKRKKR